MSRVVLPLVALLVIMVNVYAVHTYTDAAVESPFSLSISNPEGMLSLIPYEGLTVEQGKSEQALMIANNMGSSLYNCRLEYAHPGFIFSLDSNYDLAPGANEHIAVAVAEDCPAGCYLLELSLLAQFDGGSAKVKTAVPLRVTEAVMIEPDQPRPGENGPPLWEKNDPAAAGATDQGVDP